MVENMDNGFRIRRSLLFIPGSQPRMLAKAIHVGADSVILDLEDAVAFEDKDKARLLVRETIKSIIVTGIEVIVRINPLSTPLGYTDIGEITGSNPDAIMIPKATENDIRSAGEMLDDIECKNNIAKHTTKIFPLIETAYAMENVNNIIRSSDRVTGVLFGAEDYTADMEVKRTTSGDELYFARNRIAVACRAGNIDAIDTPYTAIKDLEGLSRDAKMAILAGMTGKAAIHPCQVSIINESFAPSEEEIAYAVKLVNANKEMILKGKAVFVFDGKMIDAPIIKRAYRVIAKAKLAGLLKTEE